MTIGKTALFIACVLPLGLAPPAAWSQTTALDSGMVACPSQNELEQSIGSEGAIMPDGCTTLQVNALSSDSGELCLIDFGMDEGFLGQLRDAAFPTQWWVACDELTAAAQ